MLRSSFQLEAMPIVVSIGGNRPLYELFRYAGSSVITSAALLRLKIFTSVSSLIRGAPPIATPIVMP